MLFEVNNIIRVFTSTIGYLNLINTIIIEKGKKDKILFIKVEQKKIQK